MVCAKHDDSKNVPENFFDLDEEGKPIKVNAAELQSYPIEMCALRVDWIFNE